METKQIDAMLMELAHVDHPQQPSSYQFSSPPSGLKQHEAPVYQRSNQQLIRSVLYLGLLLRKSNVQKSQGRDYVADGLEALTSVMDNLFLVTKFGLMKESPLLKKIGNHANKVWFVALVLIIKRLALGVVRLMRLKSQVMAEVRKMYLTNDHTPLKKILIAKYEAKLKEISTEMVYDVLELVGTMVDLAFVSVELLHWKINPTLEKLLGLLSTGLSVYRMTH